MLRFLIIYSFLLLFLLFHAAIVVVVDQDSSRQDFCVFSPGYPSTVVKLLVDSVYHVTCLLLLPSTSKEAFRPETTSPHHLLLPHVYSSRRIFPSRRLDLLFFIPLYWRVTVTSFFHHQDLPAAHCLVVLVVNQSTCWSIKFTTEPTIHIYHFSTNQHLLSRDRTRDLLQLLLCREILLDHPLSLPNCAIPLQVTLTPTSIRCFYKIASIPAVFQQLS